MKAFEYAAPESEAEALELAALERGEVAFLAGGTDLVGLMKQMLVTPDRVVSLSRVPSLKTIHDTSEGFRIGAMVSLDDLASSGCLSEFPAVRSVIENLGSMQLQSQGTVGGELFQRPRCWYFRAGHGLTASHGREVTHGDNRYHAIFGNTGAAKFVSPSRLAPALVALEARARVIGPAPGDEAELPLEALYRAPHNDQEREHALQPGQIVTHITIPNFGSGNATYEVRQGMGPDAPLAAAAASLTLRGGVVSAARIVLGQVAPVPWVSDDAARAMLGRPVTMETAEAAGEAAVRSARPLSDNAYKVRLAQVAVKRALLLAAGLETGGF